MDFELTVDQLELRDNARAVLSRACPPSLVRAIHDGEDGGNRLWATLVELDWSGLGIPEELGGLGLGFLELGIVVEELGRVTAPSPFLATATQLAPLLVETGAARWLPDLAGGRTTGSLALAEGGAWRLDAIRTVARRSGDGWVLHGEKSHVVDGTTAQQLGVIARIEGTAGADGIGAFLVPSTTVHATPVPTIDPTLPIASVRLDDVEVAPDRVLLEPGDPNAASLVRRALEQATTAVALSTVATCRAIFETTLQYAKDREQFGRPIGSFQALKHRLADGYLAVERASALAYFAALTIAEDDDRREVATAMAKAAAGECQRLVVRDGLQIHGGVGFTWEHDLHFLLKRAKAGDLLFGTGASHRAHLGHLLGLERAS